MQCDNKLYCFRSFNIQLSKRGFGFLNRDIVDALLVDALLRVLVSRPVAGESLRRVETAGDHLAQQVVVTRGHRRLHEAIGALGVTSVTLSMSSQT